MRFFQDVFAEWDGGHARAADVDEGVDGSFGGTHGQVRDFGAAFIDAFEPFLE
ncbi:hypothetical protein HB816_15900 [Listeria booriae]|nr:hypothetical protein [Listeria booriae]